jgi:hypothetical protein
VSVYRKGAINQSKGRKTNGLYMGGNMLKIMFLTNNPTLCTNLEVSCIKTIIPQMPANTAETLLTLGVLAKIFISCLPNKIASITALETFLGHAMTSAGFNKVVMRRIKQDSSVVSIFFVFPF